MVRHLEAALGIVLGAETPTEMFTGLVSRQRAGAVVAGGSRAGTVGVQHVHWVHPTKVAGAAATEGGADAEGTGIEEVGDVEWVRQGSWSGAANVCHFISYQFNLLLIRELI